MFYIRVDVNETIATGHVMRCLAIADAMRALGEETTFLVADETGAAFVTDKGYPVHCLHSKWDVLEEEVDALIALIQKYGIRQMLLDSYQVTPRYMERLQEHTRLIYLDDLDAFLYSCDQIINYAVYALDSSYATKDGQSRHLLGACYMPLRHAFQGLPSKEIHKHMTNILVLTGGADRYHFARKFMEAYLEWNESEQICVTIICGRYNEDYGMLKMLAAKNAGITVKQSVSDIENYMREADVAVSAGGTTLYELCACGTPTISYLLADNQRKNVEKFAELKLIPYSGEAQSVQCIPKILRQIKLWQEDARERQNISERMQNMVDGNGAMRIAQKLLGSV